MPDRYDIVRTKSATRVSRYRITRTDDDLEHGFKKYVGWFDLKCEAKEQLAKIKAHGDMNFAEWFYTQRTFYKNDTLDEAVLARHLHKIWRMIGGHLSINDKREFMNQQALLLTYVTATYKEKIDAIEDG